MEVSEKELQGTQQVDISFNMFMVGACGLYDMDHQNILVNVDHSVITVNLRVRLFRA